MSAGAPPLLVSRSRTAKRKKREGPPVGASSSHKSQAPSHKSQAASRKSQVRPRESTGAGEVGTAGTGQAEKGSLSGEGREGTGAVGGECRGEKGQGRQQEAADVAAPESGGSDTSDSWKAWVWKREARPDRDRFLRPYVHPMRTPGAPHHTLTIHQQPFSTTGFASTVWDSSIVLAKYLERHPQLVRGRTCVELGAGCGLPGIAAAHLGARHVILSDLPENIPLLQKNIDANVATKKDEQEARSCARREASGGEQHSNSGDMESAKQHSNSDKQHSNSDKQQAESPFRERLAHPQAAAVPLSWGDADSLSSFQRQCQGVTGSFQGAEGKLPVAGREGSGQEEGEGGTMTFDVVIATDVFYYDDGVEPLLWVLERVCHGGTLVLLACGRNRRAFPLFRGLAEEEYCIKGVPYDDLDPVYRCLDVEVYELRRKEAVP